MTAFAYLVVLIIIPLAWGAGRLAVARLLRLPVTRVSWGFGGRVAGFERKGVEYRIAHIPLGVYVRIRNSREDLIPDATRLPPIWRRLLLVPAGPLAIALLGLLLLYARALYVTPDVLEPAILGEVLPGGPAASSGLREGDRVTAIDGDPIRYWADLADGIGSRPGKLMALRIKRGDRELELQLTPAAKLYAGGKRIGRIGISPRFHVAQIGITDSDGPAARAGLRTGDVIVAANGRELDRWSALVETVAAHAGQALRISFVRPDPQTEWAAVKRLARREAVLTIPGRGGAQDLGIDSAEMFLSKVDPDSPADRAGLRPGDHILHFDGQRVGAWETVVIALEAARESEHAIGWIAAHGGEEREARFRLAAYEMIDAYHQTTRHWGFGAQTFGLTTTPPPEPLDHRLAYAMKQTMEILDVYLETFGRLWAPSPGPVTIGGPLMLYYTAGSDVAPPLWLVLMLVAGLQCFTFVLLSALPVPPLAASEVVYLGVEATLRRPLPRRARTIGAAIGGVLFLLLFVFAFLSDVLRYLS